VNIQVPQGQGIEMGNVTGGLRPSAITNRQQIGQEMQRNAMLELLNPTKPGGLAGQPTTPGRLPTIPELPGFTPTPGPSGVDAGLGYAAQGLGAASLIADILRRNRTRTPEPSNPYYVNLPSTRQRVSGVRFG
jgi:hypothetical protein